jgi:MFS family permease
MKISKEKLIIIITVLIDVIGVGIVIPVMPYFVQSVGASAWVITTMFAVFSLCSFLSAPLLGALSDRFGRRPALIASLASTAVGWFVFAGATNVITLFIGRIIDGMAAGNFSIAQSCMADLSKNQKERTANMGLIGAIFGIGFVIGPVIGALLSHISMAFPFYFVGVLAGLNTIAAFFFLPESNKDLDKHKKISVHPLAPLKLAWADKPLRSRYFVLFLFGLAFAAQQSVFALYTQDTFNFDVRLTGYLMTFIGIIMIVNQGYLLKHFWLKNFNEKGLEIWLLLFTGVGFFMTSFSFLSIFILGILVMTLSQSVLRAVMSSRITGLADPKAKGEVAGIMSALMTLGMIIGPLGIGFVYEFNNHLPFMFSGLFLVIAFLVMFANRNKIPESRFHHEEVEPIEVL